MTFLEPQPPKIFQRKSKQMNYIKLIFLAALFYFLIPGVLVRLPPGGSTMVVNLTHAVVFALVSSFAWGMVRSRMGK
jgi:uncharacterized membrane protein